MGFPDGYTDVPFAKLTNRYQGLGNSWAVPVIRWIGERLFGIRPLDRLDIDGNGFALFTNVERYEDGELYRFPEPLVTLDSGEVINVSDRPEHTVSSSLFDVIDTNADEQIFISPVGCKGILRRSEERKVNINPKLAEVMRDIAAQLPDEEIERISRIQPRGAFSERYQAAKKELECSLF